MTFSQANYHLAPQTQLHRSFLRLLLLPRICTFNMPPDTFCISCREKRDRDEIDIATCYYFHHLPHDVLLKLLARVPPSDVRNWNYYRTNTFPRGVTNDTVLWRGFFIRSFGRIIPHRFVVAPRNGGTFFDWRSMYLAEERRREAYRNNNQNRNATTSTTTTASSVPARISVTAEGNMHRIRSTTADRGAAPVVVRGGIARFDWSNRR